MAEHLGIAENAFAKDKKSLKRLENLKSENAKKETLFKTELFNAKADLDAFERTNKEKKRSDKLTEKQRNEYDRLHLQFEIKAKVGLTEMDILDENLARETVIFFKKQETCASLKEKIDLLKKREEETEKGIRENLENLNELRKSKKTTDLELKENLSKETETKTILSQKKF
ncbi:hypothetical protein MHBO_000565 [Bonamia ostreae]|uniref:Uncharacterized protein n=1 Tax=Bonamia ostreae TaxID=126728 RepID=A0ABV2AH89_9EUKA